MKHAVALLALAASIGEVTATWKKADPFRCPEKIPNVCEEKQEHGYDWKDLKTGHFEKYDKFNFKGWSCEEGFNKKVIKGSCDADSDDGPSFSSDKDFSVDYFDVNVDEDAELEFHYEMPDGSACKQRGSCSKWGTTIKNKNCGGAKKVTIKLPKRSDKKKCKVEVPKIGFH